MLRRQMLKEMNHYQHSDYHSQLCLWRQCLSFRDTVSVCYQEHPVFIHLKPKRFRTDRWRCCGIDINLVDKQAVISHLYE